MKAHLTPSPLWFTARSQTTTRPRVRLNPGEIYAHDLTTGHPQQIYLLSGQAWMTLEGDTEDYVLHPGHRLELPETGRVVIEPLEGPAEFTLG